LFLQYPFTTHAKDTTMRTPHAYPMLAALSCAWCVTLAGAAQPAPATAAATNPAIDMPGFLRVSLAAAQHRETRRISEAEFLRMSREPNTIVLARSREKYNELHVKGAINLSFSDIAVDSLARVIPDKNTRILIYCNNNFANAEQPFPSKLPSASLNLSTYIALYNYGYRNVYELAPLIDLSQSKLPFASVAGRQALNR
jgi:hypothetical protein